MENNITDVTDLNIKPDILEIFDHTLNSIAATSQDGLVY